MTRTIFIISFLFAIHAQAIAGPADSTGTIVKKGKLFILHKVDKGQGLYAISRRYSVPLQDILDANPGATKDLVLDQELFIPTGKKAPMEQKVVKEYFKKDKRTDVEVAESDSRGTFAKYHTVQKGETLFAISRKYKTKVDVIKSLNDLQSNELKEGQKLLVPMTQDEERKIAKKEAEQNTAEIETDNQEQESEVDLEEAVVSVVSGNYETKTEYIAEFDMHKTWERGFGQVGGLAVVNAPKRVASHHAAAIGTTIMVTNPENDKAVFVKVVAHHKLDADKGNVIVLSKTAADKIDLKDGAGVEINFAK